MYIRLKNIGNIKDATIDIDKDFIVFIGPNNTGKTYASYCLYGLREINARQFSDKFLNETIDIDTDKLFSTGSLDVDLVELYNPENVKAIAKQYSSQYKKLLPVIFGIDKENFSKSSVEINFGSSQTTREYLNGFRFSLSSIRSGRNTIIFDKKLNSSVISLSFQQIDSKELSPNEDLKRLVNIIKSGILEHTFTPFINYSGATFMPAERIGISVFNKDLLIGRFEKTNEILSQRFVDREDDFESVKKELNTYPLIIQDAVINYARFTKDKGRKGYDESFNSLADELEEKILKGKVLVNDEGDVYYEKDRKQIKLQASGSIIKSLANLVLYLRNTPRYESVLIIDEPEINLHPDNQRLIARILAKISKKGIKVIVSTHSDYFIKELNNLIMLSKKHKKTNELRKKFGYSEDEVLDSKKMASYLFKENSVEALEVTEVGMAATTIDEEINKLNSTANEIYWNLFEEE